ncbi:uncharacterized protein IWZ02DRAFT_452107 [Phyllosticta citriasiana]|uniref:Uncharacterized protein n=1 Tax=Phyllosticta citriasiana TaxID=595635 RepID=A0ABR1KZW1_9PEZI
MATSLLSIAILSTGTQSTGQIPASKPVSTQNPSTKLSRIIPTGAPRMTQSTRPPEPTCQGFLDAQIVRLGFLLLARNVDRLRTAMR